MLSNVSKQIERAPGVRGNVLDSIVVALDQLGTPASARQLALIIDVADSSILHALRKLERSELVHANHGYDLNIPKQHRIGALLLAARRLPLRTALLVATRANPSIEFAGLQRGGLLSLVYRPAAISENILRFERFMKNVFPAIRLRSLDAERLRLGTVEAIDESDQIRKGIRRSVILKGSLARSFPDRSHRGRPVGARRLRRLHPSLNPLSRRTKQELAKKYGLAELSVFGSAVRSDFRPDSDVDVLVRSRPGKRLKLDMLSGLKQDLESHFARRVDVLTDGNVVEELRPLIERDKVKLYGWTHKKRVPPLAVGAAPW